MEKDVIYIDTEDDITAIIGKIKASKERIVALVPPKRTGILQSAVNLRLLSRMAETSNKKLVLVTSNKALIALSAVAMIPIAKNLQSKPELAVIDEAEVDDGEDVIDGAQLPIGELIKTADEKPEETVDEAVETIDIEEFEKPKAKDKAPKANKDSVKIPDFQSFRNKLFIGILLLASATVFLVWALKYAPAARIIVTTRTSSAPVSATVKIGGTEATNWSKSIIQTITKQTKKDVSVDFVATGTKDNGTKASGTISLSYAAMPTKKMTVDAGQRIQFGDKVFIIQDDVIILTDTVGTAGYGTGTATAESNGDAYNVAAGACTVVESPTVSCSSAAAMTGGTTKISTIVTAADVQKASQALVDLPTIAEKTLLTKQFVNGEKVIADSFAVDRAAAVSVPAVGAEATGKAKLTSSTTYSVTAIAKSELQTYLKAAIEKQITNTKIQRMYSDGVDDVILSGYNKTADNTTVNIATVGKIGPSIDEAYVIARAKGKKFGDVQSALEAVDGVSNVDVKFSYFWVATVPSENSKITVEFASDND